MVISVPADNVEAISKIDGVLRIDTGHKGRLKTDKVREDTRVSLLNGPTVPEGQTQLTGEGVTVCVIDMGFDFQHPAFKNADGTSRIKCVYRMSDEGGHKFTVEDPDAGTITFPGSVYDTPDLVASLTTDSEEGYHGTHTASIAAGSMSPQGWGGMAPKADLVLIPMGDINEDDFEDMDKAVELAIAFAAAYAEKSGSPVVLSASLNSHSGPHNGKGTVPEAISAASQSLLPVFSSGNEGEFGVYLNQRFTSSEKSIKALLAGISDDESGMFAYAIENEVAGYCREGSTGLSVSVSLVGFDQMFNAVPLWTSDTFTVTPGSENQMMMMSSDDDPDLGQHFTGEVGLAMGDDEEMGMGFGVMTRGYLDDYLYFQLTISGEDGTEIDVWCDPAGFIEGMPGYANGTPTMSGGDWTSTSDVISVGAYCANTLLRDSDGEVTDTKRDDLLGMGFTLGDIAGFSSYGTMFNGVTQPVVCAPGVNVVAAFNHYAVPEAAESMSWQGYPYAAESGTSMSCPAVSGILALWLQACPTLTFEDVLDVLANTSRQDEFTAAGPIRWGYGKIDAKAGLDYITATYTGITTHNSDLTTHNSGTYDLQGRRVARPIRGLYIIDGQKVIVR